MTIDENSTAQKLLKSFRQLKRANWLRDSVAGYKSSDIMVLFCIKKGAQPDCPGMKVSEISHHLRVTSPTITQLVKGLEANGLVERMIDPVDRRVVRIRLTEKGEQVAQMASDAFTAGFNGLIEYLGEEQSIQLAELLNKVFQYFNEKPEA